MGAKETKRKIFAQLAALKTLNGGMPPLLKGFSVPSLLNGDSLIQKPKIGVSFNGMDLIIDLLKETVGLDELRASLVDILANLDDIELEVKNVIKQSLKGLVNCGVNPSIPAFFKDTGAGLDFELKTIDFLDIMHVDPTTITGGLIYNDVPAGLNSNDFNTFLFNTIQSTSPAHIDWSNNNSVTPNPILSFKFNANGTPNNMFNVKASTYYSNNKNLTEMNNDYVDSIKLFPSDKVLANLMDSLLGTVSASVGKTVSQLLIEEKINTIIDKISSSDDTQTIDDSFFSFTNDELKIQQLNANDRGKGVTKFISCSAFDTSVPITTVSAGITDITNTTATGTFNDKKKVINRTINTFGDSLGDGLGNSDKFSVKLNFIDNLLRKIVQVLVGSILSPKVITIFVINYMIVNGGGVQFSGIIDFMEKNKTLFNSIIKQVRNKIINMLMARLIKAITELALAQLAGNLAERGNAKKAQLLSLLGVPQDVIRKVNGYGKGLVTVNIT
jgi:hypothetical protein|tara:strand:- start:3111 stop:4613 length:1503 start_codon:yes stop_codon:yes gene_type:complete